MDSLRTPDGRFADLPDWPWAPHYAQVGAGAATARMAYVDEGPRDGRPVLLLHGEPSWGFLYRSMIAPLVAAGLRPVVPDLIGFGRSDKPTAREDYTYERHVGWVADLVVGALDLRGAVLFGQDWGGLIGLRLVAEHPDRFSAVVASNTFLPTGDQPAGEAFERWRAFSQTVPEFPAGAIVDGGTSRTLSDAERDAYDAPFPDARHQAGARQFPMLVPTTPDDPAAAANRAAWDVLRRFDKPFVCAFGDGDPVTRGADRVLREQIPGTRCQAHPTLHGAAHFCQEDAGPTLADIIVDVASGLG